MKISVIVPIYHGEKYMPDIIRQIEDCRTFLDEEDHVELLFVNDASDAPLSMKWKSDLIEIRIIDSMHHTGIHGARLRGLRQSAGEYVLFLDQDDKIVPEYFRSQLQRIGEAEAVVCKALNGGKEYYSDDTFFPNIPSKEFTLREWNLILSPGQVLIKKEFIPEVWKENVLENNGADDWFLWICMLAGGCRISLNHEILYEHVLQGSNTSNDIMGMLHSEQEMMNVIYEKKLLSERDFGYLLKGFCKKNRLRTQKLCRDKEKLDYLEQKHLQRAEMGV